MSSGWLQIAWNPPYDPLSPRDDCTSDLAGLEGSGYGVGRLSTEVGVEAGAVDVLRYARNCQSSFHEGPPWSHLRIQGHQTPGHSI